MSGLDARFITGPDLNQYFVDKDTGEALVGGQVYGYRDAARNEAKPFYQLVQGSGNPPQYSYVALPNPITLSGVGTVVDNNNNNVALYYFPYQGTPDDSNGDLDLYYVECYAAGSFPPSTPQFTREAWPFPNTNDTNPSIIAGLISNQLTNPCFTQVLFIAPSLVINFSGTGSKTISLAPGWDLFISFTGSGSVEVTQTPVIGMANLQNNPPYTLDFTIGANVSELILQQKLFHNPDWAAANSGNPQGSGFLTGSVLIAPGNTITMQYVASSGNAAQTPQVILSATNTGTIYSQINNTIQLLPADSTDTGNTGYDLIQILLPTSGTASISNVQVSSLEANVANIPYEQTTSDRQLALMFNYYKDLLEYKPLPSWLVGWNFPLNPMQFFDPAAWPMTLGGNNLSTYLWDQTILFQSVDASITPSVDPTGGLRITATLAGQHALVQYLPAAQAIEMLSRRKCIMVSANANVATVATVSLWYTKTTLPSTIGSNASIVSTLDTKGYPNNVSGTWVEVPRSGLSNATVTTGATNAAQITIPTAPAGAASFNEIPLAGWDMQGSTDINNATYFAIVFGTSLLAENDYIIYQDIACQDGDIPTVSGAMTADQVLRQCQYYYSKSFNPGQPPANAITTAPVANSYGGAAATFIYYFNSDNGGARSNVYFPVTMYQVPIINTYNPVSNNANMWSLGSTQQDSGAITISSISQSGYFIDAGFLNLYNGFAIFNWTADARLGQ